MALKYGSTTVRKIIYNGTNLKKVYYNNTLVFSTPLIYTGGDGSSIFNYVQGEFRGKNYTWYERTDKSTLDTSDMSGSVLYETYSSDDKIHVGCIRMKTQESFDISMYSNATLTFTTYSTHKNVGHNVFLRPTTLSSVNEVESSAPSSVMHSKIGQMSSAQFTLVSDLTTYKSSVGTTAYFQIIIYPSASGSAPNSWVYFQLDSLVLS